MGKNVFTTEDSQLLNINVNTNCLTAHAHTTPNDHFRIRNHNVLNSVTQIPSRGKTSH